MNSPDTPRPSRTSYGLGLLFVFVAGVIWSFMGLGVRMIEHAQAFQILFYRSLGLSVTLFITMAVQSGGRPFALIGRAGVPSILGGLFLVLAFTGSIVSLVSTSVANAVFLLATAPLFSAILGRIALGERVRLSTIVTIVVGGVGVAIMVLDGISAGRMIGNVAAILCAIAFAFFTVALRWEHLSDTRPAVLFGGIFTAVSSASAAYVADQSLVIPVHDALIAFGMGVVVLGGGMIFYAMGSRVVPAAESTLLAMSEVVLSPIWVWLLLGESATRNTWIGGSILLAALIGNAIAGLIRQRRETNVSVRAMRQQQPARRAPPPSMMRPPSPPGRRPAPMPQPVPAYARR